MTKTHAVVLGLALVSVACEPPPVFAGADRRQNTLTGRIEGDVVVSSSSRGNVVLFLFDAARPPPPAGTGRPLAFTVIARDELFAGEAEGNAGPFTAHYAFSLVSPGSYLIRGFLDSGSDFIPWYGVTAEVNAGDVGGAAIDAVTRLPTTVNVTVEKNLPQATVDVPVSISDLAKVPVDRPAFEVTSMTSLPLMSPRVSVDLTVRPVVQGAVVERQPVFLARLVDDNGDGMPDDANGDGTPDFWPRVVVRKLNADNPLLDENDLDKNGVIDAKGVDYEHINPLTGASIAADGAPDLVVLAAGFDFSEYATQLVDSMGRVKQTPTPVTHLKLVVNARAIDASNASAPQVLKQVPSGAYAVTVIQSTGQTWRVPNELTPTIASRVGLPSVESQSFVIVAP